MKSSRSGLILAWLLIASFGASVSSGGAIVNVAFDWQTVIVSFDPVFSTLKAPMLTAARTSGNETAAIGAMRTIDTSQNQYRESNYEGGSSLSYSTELTDLGETTTVTFADGIELPLTVDDLIIQSFTVDIFALQFDTAGDPIFDTASVGGETFPILGPIELPLATNTGDPLTADIPSGQTFSWGIYHKDTFTSVFSSTAPDPAASIQAALSASYLETLVIDYAFLRLDADGRIRMLSLAGERTSFDFANFDSLLGLTASNSTFDLTEFISGGADPLAVPEPAMLLLLAMGANGLLLRRKRRHC